MPFIAFPSDGQSIDLDGPSNGPDPPSNGQSNDLDGPSNSPDGPPNGLDGGAGDRRFRPD